MARANWMLCSETSYSRWLCEVEALPERKRRHWSANTVQSTGVRSRVVYHPTTLPSGAVSLFATRAPQHMAAQGFSAGTLVPFVSNAMEEREVQAARERGEELLDPDGQPLVLITDDFARTEHLRAELERGAPQHRPHRHHVRVPTAAGQPVRG